MTKQNWYTKICPQDYDYELLNPKLNENSYHNSKCADAVKPKSEVPRSGTMIAFGPHISVVWGTYLDLIRLSAYRQTNNISRTLVGNKIVYHADVDEASPIDAAPISSLLST